jgi:hypothetical protein
MRASFTRLLILSIPIAALVCFGALENNGQEAPHVSKARIDAASNAFRSYDRGEDLAAQAVQKNSDVNATVVAKEHIVGMGHPYQEDPYNSPRIQYLVSQSDIIAVCTVTEAASALNDTKRFVFTQAEAQISEYLKGQAGATTVLIAYPGGSVRVEGHTIRAEVTNIPTLQVGHKYLLFLAKIPGSDLYTFTSSEEFELASGMVSPLKASGQAPANSLLGNESNFIEAIRSNINRVGSSPAKQ